MTKKKFQCNLCNASFDENRHLGRHKQAIHGIEGKGASALRRHRKQAELAPAPELRSLTAPEPKPLPGKKQWKCNYCDKAPYTSDVGLREHLKTKHYAQYMELKERGLSPVTGRPFTFAKGTVIASNGHKPMGTSVSLDEAIQVLQVEVDTMLQVITRLKLLQQGR